MQSIDLIKQLHPNIKILNYCNFKKRLYHCYLYKNDTVLPIKRSYMNFFSKLALLCLTLINPAHCMFTVTTQKASSLRTNHHTYCSQIFTLKPQEHEDKMAFYKQFCTATFEKHNHTIQWPQPHSTQNNTHKKEDTMAFYKQFCKAE